MPDRHDPDLEAITSEIAEMLCQKILDQTHSIPDLDVAFLKQDYGDSAELVITAAADRNTIEGIYGAALAAALWKDDAKPATSRPLDLAPGHRLFQRPQNGARLVALESAGRPPNQSFLLVPAEDYDPRKEPADYPFELVAQLDEADLVPLPKDTEIPR